jgi:importin subunit beta-1
MLKSCAVIRRVPVFCRSDLCTAFGAEILPLVDKDSITQLLTKGRRSKTAKVKTLATWATREIRKLKSTSSW